MRAQAGPLGRSRQDSRNVDFMKVLQGFQRNGKVFQETVRSASLGQPPPVEFQWGHLENTRFYKVFCKGPLWDPAGDPGPAAHQPGTGAGRYCKILHFIRFYKGLGETVTFSKKQ